jgi:hypothetical protein
MDSQPSIKQMVFRAHGLHHATLRAYDRNARVRSATWAYGNRRAQQTVLATLARWGCIDGDRLTGRGRELLEALDAKKAAQVSQR